MLGDRSVEAEPSYCYLLPLPFYLLQSSMLSKCTALYGGSALVKVGGGESRSCGTPSKLSKKRTFHATSGRTGIDRDGFSRRQEYQKDSRSAWQHEVTSCGLTRDAAEGQDGNGTLRHRLCCCREGSTGLKCSNLKDGEACLLFHRYRQAAGSLGTRLEERLVMRTVFVECKVRS